MAITKTNAEARTLQALREAPARLSIPQAGSWLGLGRANSYQLAQRGEFPVEVRKVGERFYVLTADLARALGIDPADLLRD